VVVACAISVPSLLILVQRVLLLLVEVYDLHDSMTTHCCAKQVTNPMFESHAGWWDLLCQLDLPNGTGTVLTADEKAAMDEQKSGKKAPPRPPARLVVL
jgi:Stabilization of polarity axis